MSDHGPVDWECLDARIVTEIVSWLGTEDLRSLRGVSAFFRRLVPPQSPPPPQEAPAAADGPAEDARGCLTPPSPLADEAGDGESQEADDEVDDMAEGGWKRYSGTQAKKLATLSKHRALFSIMHLGKVELPKAKPAPPVIPPKPVVLLVDGAEEEEEEEEKIKTGHKLKKRLHRKCKSIGNRSKIVGVTSSPVRTSARVGADEGKTRHIGPTRAERESARLRRVRAGTLPPCPIVFQAGIADDEVEQHIAASPQRQAGMVASLKGRTALSHGLLPLGAGAESTDQYTLRVSALDLSTLRVVCDPTPEKALDLLVDPEHLQMANCCIQYLPDALVLEEDLKDVDLSSNAFLSLPQELSNFRRLRRICVAGNYLRSAALDWAPLAALTELDLSRNHISHVPTALGKLVRLVCLRLDDNFLTEVRHNCLPSSLEELFLKNNYLWRLPPDLERLSSLRTLDVRGNCLHRLGDEPLVVGAIASGLRVLEDAECSLLRLGKERLASCARICLARRSLLELPPVVLSMQNLLRLDLSHNRLTKLPFEMKLLKKLTEMVLDHNLFRSIPLPAGRLPSLERLSMSGNRMTILRVAPAPGEAETNLFPALHHLCLSSSGIEDVILSLKNIMPKVSELLLDHNRLVGLPPQCLPLRLNVLDLSNNRIKTLSNVTFGPTLHTIRLRHNKLSQLPIGLADCKHLLRLDVTGNPLDCIPRGVLERTDTTDVFEYLRALTEDCRPLNVSKLVVFGDSTVGKSQFLRGLRRITNTNADQPARFGSLRSTQRKQMVKGGSRAGSKKDRLWQPFPEYPFRFCISKFKSPIEYHVHRFLFQSLNSIYVLVFHMGKPQEFDSMIAKWINSVQEWAPSTSLFLVGMHMDPHQPDPKAYLQFINQKLEAIIHAHIRRLPEECRIKIESCAIQMEEATDSRYNLRRFTADLSAGQMAKRKISVVDSGEGDNLSFWPVTGGHRSSLFEQLRHRLVDVALSIPAVLQQVPQQYEPMRLFMEDKGRDLTTPLLQWSEVLEWGKSWEMDEGMVACVIDQLQHAGLVLYIPNTGTILSDYVIVDPTILFRITGAIVAVMKKGVVELDELLQAWSEYPAVMHRFLLQLMLYYDIVVSVGVGTKGVRYLSPLFLPEERPSVITSATFRPGMVARTYSFPVVLPVGFMTGLLRRLLQFTGADHLWQAGCVLRLGDEIALVESSPLYNAERSKCSTELVITCFSSVGHPPTTLFQPVILALESMCMDWYSRLRNTAEVYAPCPSCLKKEVERPHRFNVEQCIGQFMEEENDHIAASEIRFECPVDGDLILAHWLIPELRSPFNDMEEDMQHPDVSYSDLEQGTSMGEGSYAQVFRAQFKLVGMPVLDVAIKKTRSFMVSLQSLVEFQNEVALLRMLDHPNVIRLFHAYIRPPSIISEYLSLGSLDRYIYEPKEPLSAALQLRLALDIAEGVACMHTQKTPILHRDLKSANVLVASLDPRAEVCAKICDLGLSVTYTGNESKGTNDNPRWTAPEVLQGKPYTPKSDVYSYAMVVYEVVASCLPFDDDTFEFVVKERAVKGDRPEIPCNCHPALVKILKSCWHQDPVRRPHLIDLLPSLRAAINAELGEDPLLITGLPRRMASPFRSTSNLFHSPVRRRSAQDSVEAFQRRGSSGCPTTLPQGGGRGSEAICIPSAQEASSSGSELGSSAPSAGLWGDASALPRPASKTMTGQRSNALLADASSEEEGGWRMASRPSPQRFSMAKHHSSSRSSESLRLPSRLTIIGGREAAVSASPSGSVTARMTTRPCLRTLEAPKCFSDEESTSKSRCNSSDD